MALYQNGILISGANTLPQMTLAEYNALPVSERPTYWERTDLNYTEIPIENVTFTPQSNVTINSDRSHIFKSGKLCFVQLWVVTSSAVTDIVSLSNIVEKYDWSIFSAQDCVNDSTVRKVWARVGSGNIIQMYTVANSAPQAGTYFINGVIALA